MRTGREALAAPEAEAIAAARAWLAPPEGGLGKARGTRGRAQCLKTA